MLITQNFGGNAHDTSEDSTRRFLEKTHRPIMGGGAMSTLRAIRSSSLDAYHGVIVGDIEIGQAELVEIEIGRQELCTRRMIAESLGMETSTVSARVNKLIKDGRVIETGYRKPCPITGISVNWLLIKPMQSELFA